MFREIRVGYFAGRGSRREGDPVAVQKARYEAALFGELRIRRAIAGARRDDVRNWPARRDDANHIAALIKKGGVGWAWLRR